MSFRYHVVSLAAALLALAAGVILGAGPLAAQVNQAVGPAKDDPAVTADAATQKARIAYDDAWAAAAGPRLVQGALVHKRVVVVVAPSTPATLAKAVSDEVVAAGGTVTGQVQLTAAWLDPAQATVLSGITDQLAPSGTKDETGSPAQRSAAALAAALTGAAGTSGGASDPATALLSGLRQGGFLTWSGTAGGAAPGAAAAAVLVAPATLPATLHAGSGANGVVTVGAALDAAGSAVVVAGPTGSAAAGGTVAAVRGDVAARAALSTVDCADLASGRATVALALAQALAGGHGQYGTGPGADAPLPRS